MNNQDIKFWLIVAFVLLIAISAPVACTMQRNNILKEAMEKGVDPIAAKCALESANSMDMLCISNTLAMRKEHDNQSKN